MCENKAAQYYPDYAYDPPVLMPENKIYTDPTNKNCKIGDIEKVEYDHPKEDVGDSVFNYLIAYDLNN